MNDIDFHLFLFYFWKMYIAVSFSRESEGKAREVRFLEDIGRHHQYPYTTNTPSSTSLIF